MPGRLRAEVAVRCLAAALVAALVALGAVKTPGRVGTGVVTLVPAGVLLSAHSHPEAASSSGGTTTGSTQVTVASTVPTPVPSTSPPEPSTSPPASTTPTTFHNTATTAPRTTTRTIPRTGAPYYPQATYYPPATAGQGLPAPASGSQTTQAPTTTSTTIAAIGGQLPAAPATLPLALKGSSAHVSPFLAILSGVGFFAALLIAGTRFFMTRAGGADRRPFSE